MSIIDSATAILGAFRRDGWSNAYTRVGGPKIQATAFSESGLLSDEFLDSWYGEDDIARRIVEALPEHAMMLGFGVADDDDGDTASALRRWDAVQLCTDADVFGRLFGGAAILIGTKNGDMSEPLGDVPADGLAFLDLVDKRDIAPSERYRDPLSPKYNEPEFYSVSRVGESSGHMPRVHESRLIIFGGLRTSQRSKLRNGGWDYSVLRPVYQAIRDFHGNWNAVNHLFADLTQPVYHIKDLAEKLAAGNKEKLADRLGLIEVTRSMARAVMVDADEEDFTQVGAANVGGVSGLVEKVWQRIAAAAGMPVTILMGMSPAGMNATGESDMRSWFNHIQTHREQYLTPRLRRLVQVIAQDAGIALDEPRIEWPSLWQMSPDEEAAYRKMIFEGTIGLVDRGIIDERQAYEGHFGSGKFNADLAPTLAASAPVDDEPIVPEEELALPAAPEKEDVQKSALNGAQISSMQEVLVAVSEGVIPRESGVAMLAIAFPISEAEAERVMGTIGKGFEPTRPEPAAPPMPPVPPAPDAPEPDDEEEDEEGESPAEADED